MFSRRTGNLPRPSQLLGVPGNAVRTSPPFPTVPGIPRSCDTSRTGSAGTSGNGVRVDVWGWETTVALRDTVQ